MDFYRLVGAHLHAIVTTFTPVNINNRKAILASSYGLQKLASPRAFKAVIGGLAFFEINDCLTAALERHLLSHNHPPMLSRNAGFVLSRSHGATSINAGNKLPLRPEL
jgi:hypothetical protein